MTAQPEITQRDLRNRSKEIMDAVENGQAFIVTRDGHRIGELIRIPFPQVVVGDPAGPGQQVEAELLGLVARVHADVLEPLE